MLLIPNKVDFLSIIARLGGGLFFLLLTMIFTEESWGLTFNKSSRIETFAVDVAVIVDPEQVNPGARFYLRLRVTIPEGWHIYSMQLEGENSQLATIIRFNENAFPILGKWEESSPQIERDEVLQKIVKSHSLYAEFNLLQHVPEAVAQGDYFISGMIVYHACDNKVCTLPKELPFKTRIGVVSH